MGVVHLAPVGTSPGAVTAGLAYLKHHADHFHGYKGQIIESVVVFGPTSVATDECVLNEYGEARARKRWRQGDTTVADVVRQYIASEIAPIMPDKGALYLWTVDPHDFDACLDALAEATLTLGRPDTTGKLLWANLTGGTNVLNAALMEVATLSGLVARVYYTFLADDGDRKYLQPATTDERYFLWDEVAVFKTVFDAAYYRVLAMLAELGDWCADRELWQRLKNDEEVWRYYGQVTLEQFRDQLLNRMDGREIERDAPTGHRVRLGLQGRRVLEHINRPLFKALVQRGRDADFDAQAQRRTLQEKVVWEKKG